MNNKVRKPFAKKKHPKKPAQQTKKYDYPRKRKYNDGIVHKRAKNPYTNFVKMKKTEPLLTQLKVEIEIEELKKEIEKRKQDNRPFDRVAAKLKNYRAILRLMLNPRSKAIYCEGRIFTNSTTFNWWLFLTNMFGEPRYSIAKLTPTFAYPKERVFIHVIENRSIFYNELLRKQLMEEIVKIHKIEGTLVLLYGFPFYTNYPIRTIDGKYGTSDLTKLQDLSPETLVRISNGTHKKRYCSIPDEYRRANPIYEESIQLCKQYKTVPSDVFDEVNPFSEPLGTRL